MNTAGLVKDNVTRSCPDYTAMFSQEGAGQAAKAIRSYTTPVWHTLSVAGVSFSLLQVSES